MNLQELIEEQTKLKRIMMMARGEVSRQQNPQDPRVGMDKKAQQIGLTSFGSMKITKWKHAIISQRLHELTIRGLKK